MSEYPTYAPDFQIRINGDQMPASLRSMVTGVNYQDGRNAADRVEIDIANPDLRWLRKHIRGLGVQPFPTAVKAGPIRIYDDDPEGAFNIENSLNLELGYANTPLESVFKGEITGVEATFPSGGMPAMKVVAHDKLHRMAQGTGARGFGFIPDFLSAVIVSAKNMLIPVIDPTIIAASTAIAALNFIFTGTGEKQAATGEGMSDLMLLQQIASRYDADFWVDGDFLHVSRFLKEYTPSVTLRWGDSLQDFSPRMSAVGQVAGVAFRFTLREIPLSFIVTAAWNFDKEVLTILIAPGAAGPPGVGAAMTIVDHTIASPADIASSALKIVHTLREKPNARLTGSGSTVGDPRIRAGAMIRLDGLGPDFSGDYRISSATHSVNSGGYRTNFEVFKEIIP